MEPIPETAEAPQELSSFGEDSTARTLLRISRSVEEIVTDLSGISLSLVADNLTLTMVATTPPVVEHDAMQYLDGASGPPGRGGGGPAPRHRAGGSDRGLSLIHI